MKFYLTVAGTEIALDDLGVTQLLGQTAVAEPPDSPVRRRVTVRFKLDFFEQSYRDNYSLVSQVRAALRRPDTTLRWNDSGSNLLNRTVTVGDEELPDDPNAWGTYHQSITFSVWYYDHLTATESGTIGATYQRAGGPLQTLREVETFAERYQSTLFDEMRAQRRRVAGQISLSGRWQGDTTTPIAQRQAALQALKDSILAQFQLGSSGRFRYGTFDKIVRIIEFEAQVNQPKNFIAFTLTGNFTRFPNESDYALCEFKLTRKENKIEGTVSLIFSGKIGAPTLEAAQAKLAALQASLIPAAVDGIGYALVEDDQDDNRVCLDSTTGGVAEGDGQTFTELSFNQEWRKYTGDILEWTMKKTDADDVKAGYIRSTYSGSVLARGDTIAAATATALAKAAEIGANKYPFMVQSSLAPDEKLFQTSGGVFFVRLEFSYEYQRKGVKTFLEVTSETANETFGQTLENVSGFIMAPDLATALSVYNSDVRNVASYPGFTNYTGLLLLNERKPSLARETIRGEATQDHRFTFSFSLHKPKAAGDTAMNYTMEPDSNFQAMEKTTVVTGSVFAASEAVALIFLDAYLATATVALGKRTSSRRRADYEQGNGIGVGGKVTAFLKVDFTETYVGALTGVEGILECEVTLENIYSTTRWVEKPLPDGPSVIQDCGITVGTRSVSGNVTATTRAACETYARQSRTGFITGPYEQPMRISTVHRFLPQINGIATGIGANVKLYVAQFQFSELIPQLAFVP